MARRRVPSKKPDRHRQDKPALDALVRLLEGRIVAYHPRFVQITGRVTAAVMLAQLFYWSRTYLRAHPQREGWMWKSQEEWERETGLSRREQENARATLCQLGIITERKRYEGTLRRLEFRLNLDRFGSLLAAHLQMNFTHWDWNDERTIGALTGKPFPYYRDFAHLTGSVNAGVLLSRLVLWARTHGCLPSGPLAWMPVSLQEIERNSGLSRSRQEGARNLLRALNLIEEDWKGIPAVRLTRIDCVQLLSQLRTFRGAGHVLRCSRKRVKAVEGGQGQCVQTLDSIASGCKDPLQRHAGRVAEENFSAKSPVCTRATNKDAQKRHTSMHKNATPGCANPPHRRGAHAHPRVADLRILSKQEITYLDYIQLPQTPTRPSLEQVRAPSPAAKGGGGNLDSSNPTAAWDRHALELTGKGLTPPERQAALDRVCVLPTQKQAQEVLDELIGQINQAQRSQAIHNPLGYLRTLIGKCLDGTFEAELSYQERLRRESRRRHDEALRAAAALPVPPSISREHACQLAGPYLRQLRDILAGRATGCQGS